MEKKIGNSRTLFFAVAAAVFAIVGFGGIKAVQAAHFYFSPSTGVFHKNENFTVKVFVSAEIAINAAQGTISFPSEYLEVISAKSNSSSIVDFWVQKPSFSNAGAVGNVSFGGVILNPGFSGTNGKITDIIFRVKKEGTAELIFSESAILANDGLGTNVSAPNEKANFVLIQALPVEEQKIISQPDLEALQEKIESFEQKIETVGQPTTQIVMVESEKGILNFWKILPRWVKISVLALVGVAAVILSLIIVGLGLVILIWLLRYLLRLPSRIKGFFAHFSDAAETAKEEFRSDIKYAERELKKDFRKIESGDSLKTTLKNSLISLKKIVRRFFTKNK